MKLKFKAELQDIVIFIVFAIFLLYIIALAMVNIPSLSVNGEFAGLNPLPAFAEDKIVPTLGFYILALAGLFMSVKSYFFDVEKGFGISTEKSNKGGYSRWAKEKEIKTDDGIAEIKILD